MGTRRGGITLALGSISLVTLLVGCASTRDVATPGGRGARDDVRGELQRLATTMQLAAQQQEAIRAELMDLIHEQAVDRSRRSATLEQRLEMVEQRLQILATTLNGSMLRLEAVATSLDAADARAAIEPLAGALTALTARVDEINARLAAREHETPAGVVATAPGVPPTPPAPAEPVATRSTNRAGSRADPRPGTEPVPRDLYQAAYFDFSRGNYALAIGGFREFLRRHPGGDTADNAQYWIGEAYLSLAHRYHNAEEPERAEQALKAAAQAFREVGERYPGADKVPAALYREALVLLELKQPAPARDRFAHLVDRFPATPEARWARERMADSPAP